MNNANAGEKLMENQYKPEFIKTSGSTLKKISTRPFGDVEVFEEQIIEFPEGIPGFGHITAFAFMQELGTPFVWMQAVDEAALSFIVIEPENFVSSYDLVISQSDLECVGASDCKDLKVLFVVTIPDNPEDMTANLQGPIILNLKNRKGKQAISLSEKYHVRHRIVDDANKNGGD